MDAAHTFFDQSSMAGSEATAIGPLVHPQETSVPLQSPHSYRAFLISGMTDKIERAGRLYQIIDDRDGKHRQSSYHYCREIAWFVRHRTTHEVRIAASRCNLRWCPLCIKTKRYIMRQSLTPWVKAAKKPKFMTFTLKHTSTDLTDQITRLYDGFKLLRRSKLWKKHIMGGVWFFQVKKSKSDGLWHPHLHVIAAGTYLPQDQLSAQWLKCTGDSKIADIRAVKDAKKTADYVSRYATAPCRMEDYSDSEAVEIFDALAGRRICGTFGNGKSIQLVPKKCPDADEWENVGTFFARSRDRFDDEISHAIFKAWVRHEPCHVELPKPPPKSVELKAALTEQPSKFHQAVFEWTEFYR